MNYVNQIHNSIDIKKLQEEVSDLIHKFKLEDYNQISLTSLTGTEWLEGTGKGNLLNKPLRFYNILNENLQDTYISEIIKTFPKYYRWRLMKLPRLSCYSIHKDSLENITHNKRVHIPVFTNTEAYLVFYKGIDKPKKNAYNEMFYAHLEEGYAYEVDTTWFHTAINFHLDDDRYHIIAERNEYLNNRT